MNNLKELYLTYPVEQLFHQLTKNIVIKVDEEKYPDSVFYFKNDNCIFDYDKKTGYFWCDYYKYWSKFYEKFNLNYYIVRDLTKDMVEKHFKIKGITPKFNAFNIYSW